MSTVIELNFKSGFAQQDWQGKWVGQRVWWTDIRDPKSALDYAKEYFGIDVNMPYPGITGLVADVRAVGVDGQGVGNEITLTFSSDRRFGGSQNIDKDAPGYYTTDIDIRNVAFPTPVNFRTTINVTSGGTTESTDVWDIENHNIDEPRAFFEVNTVTTGWSLNKTKAVLLQVNKIHTIGGIQLLFRGGRTYQRRQATATQQASYDLTYIWEMDPGTERVDSPDPDVFVVGINTALRRQPFSRYVIRPSTDPANAEHEVYEFPQYDSDPGGYLTLPSIPPI